MAVISKEKELGAKPTIFKPFPFHSTAFILPPRFTKSYPPFLTLPLPQQPPASSEGHSNPKHTFVSCWGTIFLVSSFYPAAVFALGTAKFTSPVQVHAQPQGCILPSPEARGVWDPLGISGEVQPVEYKPWILLSKRTNSFLNTSLLFLLWFRMHLPKLLLCKCVRAWISARGSKVM